MYWPSSALQAIFAVADVYAFHASLFCTLSCVVETHSDNHMHRTNLLAFATDASIISILPAQTHGTPINWGVRGLIEGVEHLEGGPLALHLPIPRHILGDPAAVCGCLCGGS